MNISLGKHWDEYINGLVASGRYASASEAVRNSLRLLQAEEDKLTALAREVGRRRGTGRLLFGRGGWGACERDARSLGKQAEDAIVTRRLEYLSAAHHDLGVIAAYIAETSGERSIGEAYVERLRARCRELAALPFVIGRERPECGEGRHSIPHYDMSSSSGLTTTCSGLSLSSRGIRT